MRLRHYSCVWALPLGAVLGALGMAAFGVRVSLVTWIVDRKFHGKREE